jgi:hypothetical protein
MERTAILELISTLKLYGMRAAYDEVMTTGIKRRHEPPRILGELLSAEIAEKQARSIKYQLTRFLNAWRHQVYRVLLGTLRLKDQNSV